MNEKSSGEREQLAAETLDERLQRAREKRDRLVKERECHRQGLCQLDSAQQLMNQG
jgi:hypothetical protein